MKKLKAKLIVSDFDGTLANSEHTVPERVAAAISEFVESGGIFAVCTGRMMPSIMPRVRSLGLKGLVVACQGTVIAEIESGNYIKFGGLKCEDAAEICAALEECGYNVNAYCGDDMFTSIEEGNEYLERYQEITGITALHADLPVHEYIKAHNLNCQKVASLCFPEDRSKIYSMLKSRFDDKYDIAYSADVLVEVAPAGDNKGSALAFLADYYGVDIKDTVAVGDNLNDLPMIIAAGTGVAVGNAERELKEHADYIAPTNDEDAVAAVIEKFGYYGDE